MPKKKHGSSVFILSIVFLSLMFAACGGKEAPITAPTGAQAGDLLELAPCTFSSIGGDLAAECGTLVVPENRGDPNTRLIALAGLITGISASFSMAASEYLSTKSEESEQNPVKAAIYTGLAYIFTVAVLVLPFFLFNHYLVSIGMPLVNAILVIAVFNYYISVAKDLSFRKRFLEMAGISLGVAIFSFLIGNIIGNVLGVDIGG